MLPIVFETVVVSILPILAPTFEDIVDAKSVVVLGLICNICCVWTTELTICAEILGELVVLMPPIEAELATIVDVDVLIPPEATEVLNEVDWKMHKKMNLPNDARDRLLEESIDVMKFLLGLMIVNGFTVDQVYDMFKSKSIKVEKRLKED